MDVPAEALAIALIDTRPFQRLRRIRQLGPAFLTFHGAESSRFTHSLGVLHLARLAMKQLEQFQGDLARWRPLLYAAALLHDVGHAPLSHSGEDMFGLRHETWSARLIREHPDLCEPLNACEPGLAAAVADLLEHGRHPCQAMASLISSQLDCDRLDYLLRDSYSTGTRYGVLDLERLIASLTLAPDGSVAIHPKGLMAAEHYLVVRQLMYRTVYNHRLNVVCNWLLQQTIALARRLGPKAVWADDVMHRWLWHRDQIDLESYLANDDLRTGYHLLRWRQEAPTELAEICARLLDRRLLRATDVTDCSQQQQLELLAQAQRLTCELGLSPDSHCGLQQRRSHGYDPYRSGLRLWDGERLQALERRSKLVQALVSPMEMAWLIHPREVSQDLRSSLAAIREAH